MKSVILLLLVAAAAACQPGHPSLVKAVADGLTFLEVTEMPRGSAHDELRATIDRTMANSNLCWTRDAVPPALRTVADPVVADALAWAYHHLILVEYGKALERVLEDL